MSMNERETLRKGTNEPLVNNKQELIDLFPEYSFEDISYNYELDNLTYRNLMFKGTPK